MTEAILFYAFAGLILLSAILMVTSKNVFYSALYLALSLMGVAAIFVILNAYFLAGIQVLIYIGAVVVLAIFVINLTKQITGKDSPQFNRQIIPAILVSLTSAAVIILAVLKSGWAADITHTIPAAKTELIGKLLLTDFVVPFEVISVLLLASLIGAVVIVSADKEEKK